MVAEEQNRMVEEFFRDADLLVHDTQYTQEEYESAKLGWGHTSFEYAIAAAKRAGVKKIALFHHEPIRGDEQMDGLAEEYCASATNGDPEIFFAQEGMEIDI